MWGILTNMVTTRRSTRLQEKQATASAPTSPTPSSTVSSPSTRRARNTTTAAKTTPSVSTRTRRSTSTKASPGSGTKRGRPRKNKNVENESDEASATQSDAASDQHTDNGSMGAEETVVKELFAEETKDNSTELTSEAQEEEQEPTNDVVGVEMEVGEKEPEPEASPDAEVEVEETESEPEVAPPLEANEENSTEPAEAREEEVLMLEKADKEEPQQEDEEEETEEEIVMMDSSDGEEEDAEEVGDLNKDGKNDDDEADTVEDEDDEDFDVVAFAKQAASGINFSATTKNSSTIPTSTTKTGLNLVPDSLDSGASSRTKFLEFDGTKQGLGAKVVASAAAVEEQKVLAHQLGKVAKSNRQRTEAQNMSTAGRKWFDMATHEMDADARRDFALLKMRNYLDPKKFYKTSDHTKKMPKHFQFGTVIEGAHEFKSARLTKKERQQTFTDEIMADEGIRTYTKRVFLQVQNARAGGQGKKKKQKRF